MDDTRAGASQAKEPYEKPEVRKVKLIAGEVAVTGCKTATSITGALAGGCFKSMCKDLGS